MTKDIIVIINPGITLLYNSLTTLYLNVVSPRVDFMHFALGGVPIGEVNTERMLRFGGR